LACYGKTAVGKLGQLKSKTIHFDPKITNKAEKKEIYTMQNMKISI
jgi:hypothetical protein